MILRGEVSPFESYEDHIVIARTEKQFRQLAREIETDHELTDIQREVLAGKLVRRQLQRSLVEQAKKMIRSARSERIRRKVFTQFCRRPLALPNSDFAELQAYLRKELGV